MLRCFGASKHGTIATQMVQEELRPNSCGFAMIVLIIPGRFATKSLIVQEGLHKTWLVEMGTNLDGNEIRKLEDGGFKLTKKKTNGKRKYALLHRSVGGSCKKNRFNNLNGGGLTSSV